MILWLLINISMACAQATRIGGRVTDSMVLVLFFQGLYIMDALYNEVSPSPDSINNLHINAPRSPQF
jgi:hypothetical protein